jgi:hypothetical protein
MIQLTQTHEGEFGNCWQTAVACVLELPASELPDQHLIEKTAKLHDRARTEEGSSGPPYYAGHFSYMNALNAYLAKHHRLAYVQERAWHFSTLQFQEPGWHFAIGPTSRNAFLHCVVARHGEQVWDPNSSRAGLSEIESFGYLARLPESYEKARYYHLNDEPKQRERIAWTLRHEKPPSIGSLCCCPACFVDGEYINEHMWTEVL